MNKFAVFSTVVATGLFVLCPNSGVAQEPSPKRSRPAARSTPAPTPAPQNAKTATTPEAIPAPEHDPKSPTPPSEDPADTAEPTTVIDAYESTSFASKDRIVVFKGKVKVVDPRFQLVCDELTVFLNKVNQPEAGVAPGPGGAPTPAASPKPSPTASGSPPSADAKPSGGGGIDHAIAKGHVIILQKRAATKDGAEAKVSIGRGEEGTFDNKSGDMTLKGTPSIEQNGNTHVAISPDTVMTIHRDGGLDTVGPAKTTLIQRKGSNGFDLPGGLGAGGDPARKGASPTPQPSPAARKPVVNGKPHG